MHVIDISIVVVYLLSCLIIGYYKTTDVKNITEYTLGNRNFQTVTLVATVFATYISARASVGDVALIYSSGMIYGTALILSFILWIIFSTVFAKNIDQFYGCISLSEIVDKLYGKSGLIVSNICIFFVSVGVIATQVIAIGYLFKHFLGLSYGQRQKDYFLNRFIIWKHSFIFNNFANLTVSGFNSISSVNRLSNVFWKAECVRKIV